MTSSAFPLPPFLVMGLLLAAGGLLVGVALRLLARTDAARARVRASGLAACAVAVVFVLVASWTTGPFPASVTGWLAWPAAPALLAAGGAMLLPRVRARATAAKA